jgi:glutaredoxin-like protein
MIRNSEQIVVYGTLWCPDCWRSRRLLDRNSVAYCWVDIDRDAQARAFVERTNKGMRSVPTIVFPDGSILVEPSDHELADKLSLV